MALEREEPSLLRPETRLIADYCNYNTYSTSSSTQYDGPDLGIYWVGDLTINFELEIEKIDAEAEIVVELVEGQDPHAVLVE